MANKQSFLSVGQKKKREKDYNLLDFKWNLVLGDALGNSDILSKQIYTVCEWIGADPSDDGGDHHHSSHSFQALHSEFWQLPLQCKQRRPFYNSIPFDCKKKTHQTVIIVS